MCVRACVRACVGGWVRAFVRACVRACVLASIPVDSVCIERPPSFDIRRHAIG